MLLNRGLLFRRPGYDLANVAVCATSAQRKREKEEREKKNAEMKPESETKIPNANV